MKFAELLRDFEGYHQTLGNRLYHYAGLSIITIASLGLLDQWSIGAVPLSIILLLGTLSLDLLVCPVYALPVLAVGGLFLAISWLFSLYQLVLLFIAGWIFQLLGHRLAERNQPAFVKNMLHLYVGPRWLLLQWLQVFGWLIRDVDHRQINTDGLDVLRSLLSALMPWLSRRAALQVNTAIQKQPAAQKSLRDFYQVQGKEPTLYTEALRTRIIQLQASMPASVFIYTSGSTSKPKQIIYNPERLRLFKKASVLTALQVYGLLRVKTPSMFVFASLQKDDSFASLVVARTEGMPGVIEGLIEPAKFMFHPLLRGLLPIYGVDAVRLWIIALSDPALLYATNPSTLAVFLGQIEQNWIETRRMFRDFLAAEGGFQDIRGHREWIRLIVRMARPGYGARVNALAQAERLPDFAVIAPSLKAYVCWDGGYVTAFLKQVRRLLPVDRYAHVPMFSMSTETLQTQTYIYAGAFRFLPLADRVLYEFYPEHTEGRANQLLLGHELAADGLYVMVVSDPWGLCRYDTQDVFHCRALIQGQPDLAFVRRAGLNYSFTGEKITGDQVLEALAVLQAQSAQLQDQSIQYTLIPSQPETGLPYYVLLLACIGEMPGPDTAAWAEGFDQALSAVNHEYRDKRLSQRLDAVRVAVASYDVVARHLDTKTRSREDIQNRSWESQFKLTPLTKILWQNIGLDQN